MSRELPARHADTHRPAGTLGPDDPGGSDAIVLPTVSVPSAVLFAGSVYNDGDIRLPASSPGFSVVFTAPNLYDITFDTELPAEPVINLTANNNNPAGSTGQYDASIVNGSVATTGFSVITTQFDGTASDGGFDFVCVAPGPGSS